MSLKTGRNFSLGKVYILHTLQMKNANEDKTTTGRKTMRVSWITWNGKEVVQ